MTETVYNLIPGKKRINLGCGSRPMPDSVNHDRTIHSEWVDEQGDLEVMPWPWGDETWEEVWAFDVMEHLHMEVNVWLDECWRILVPGGQLFMRLPAFDNHLSYRDPTHVRVFHPESFFYWDPTHHLWKDFGRFYWDTSRWWEVRFRGRDNGDLRFELTKLVGDS